MKISQSVSPARTTNWISFKIDICNCLTQDAEDEVMQGWIEGTGKVLTAV